MINDCSEQALVLYKEACHVGPDKGSIASLILEEELITKQCCLRFFVNHNLKGD
jgi:hypothetical protein